MKINDMLPNTGRYFDEGGKVRNIIERITGALNEINSDHAAIHSGYGYCLHLYHATLAAGASKIYRIKGPTTLFAHIKSIQIAAQGAPLRVELIQEANFTNLGVEITGAIRNLNHNYPTANQTKVYDGSVAYTGGVVWCSVVVYGDTSGAGAGLSASSGQFIQSDYLEYVTKDGEENYVLKITNLNAGGGDPALHINSNMFFYEEPLGFY